MARLFQDVRYALRLLTRTPGFAAVAILTLALGIGANTAIFTVVNALLIQPLPYRHAERLVMVWQDLRARGGPADEWATPGNYADWRKEKAIFDEVAVISGWRPTLTGGAEPEPIPGEQVSHEYFSVLGVDPLAGPHVRGERRRAERAAGGDHQSRRCGQRRFGGDRSVIGRIVAAQRRAARDRRRHAGGIPPDRQRRSAEIWRPLAHQHGRRRRAARLCCAPWRASPKACRSTARRRRPTCWPRGSRASLPGVQREDRLQPDAAPRPRRRRHQAGPARHARARSASCC